MEPIAIVGMGCRFPGGRNPEEFWQLLQSGGDAITEVPTDRWPIDDLYSPEPTPGKISTRYGGFLAAIDRFDPHFFGISPREAERIDPQQRLVLEVAWEALENAAIAPDSLAHSATGVFIGCGNFDYGLLLSQERDRISAYDGTGSTIGIVANRLSYLLNLRGPSLSLETACSSSLVAVHVACQSLRSRETDMALVGAVSLMLSPAQTIAYSQARMMAPDGRCKTFDASANGYVRGEGCGLVVLKLLTDAQRDGDRVLAVIRGSAVNQDGLSNGLTAPNGPSQQAVIRRALANAGVTPDQVSYVEAHGTGTALGDPIEMRSLKAVLLPGRSPEQPCWIGSVKTNIGHLEAAAGMAGLIKVVLALQYQEIPPHLHLQELNPLIAIANTPLAIPTQRQPWQVQSGSRIAGISSFGFGGTNAHLIVEEAPAQDVSPLGAAKIADGPLHLVTLSAKDPAALQQMADSYARHLLAHPRIFLADVSLTTHQGRNHFEHRLGLVAATSEELQLQLKSVATGQMEAGIYGHLTRRQPPRLGFLFTGQGSQYIGMARQLYETQPVFRQTLQACDQLLQAELQPSLLTVLYPDNDTSKLLSQTAYTQPALFAVEYALYQLWQSWGIKPTVVMGHSVGEYVAACVAGVFSWQDGLRLMAARGRLMQELPPGGGMVAVLATADQIVPWMAPYANQIAIAAFNGPNSLVLSGQQQALETLAAELTTAGIKTKPLEVSHAFHSLQMEPMVAAFRQVAESIAYAAPTIPIVSSVTGRVVTHEMARADYWCRHILQPVRFADGMVALMQQRCHGLLEIGANPLLLGMGRHCVSTADAAEIAWLPSLRRGQPDRQTLMQSLGELYVRGAAIDWQAIDQGPAQRLPLPTYAFQRQRYWFAESATVTANSAVSPSSPVLSLLAEGQVPQLVELLQSRATLSSVESQLLSRLLELLVRQHQEQIATADLAERLYTVEWQVKNRSTDSLPTKANDGSWILLADRLGIGEWLAAQLRAQGAPVVLLYAGACDRELAPQCWEVNPSGDWASRLQNLTATLPAPQRILHFWSLDMPTDLATADIWEPMQSLGCGSLLHLMQGLAAIAADADQLWIITHGATAAAHGLTQPAASTLWGMGQGLMLEFPDRLGGLIDLPTRPDSTDLKALLEAIQAEIQQPDGEDRIAYRGSDRYVARLVPRPPTQTVVRLPIADQQTYWITGGLGALGLKLADWLVSQGARHLVLSGRQAPSPEALTVIQRLQTQGVTVVPLTADVTQESDLQRVLNTIQQTLPPLKGVIHAAGTVGYEPLPSLSWDTFASVLRPKVIGAWLLHCLTQHLELDYFVLFSSISSVWGAAGQTHYSAANAFLDGLAQYRQQQHLSALSVNWGPWGGSGMAIPAAQERLAQMGITTLTPVSALASLQHLLLQNHPQVTVAHVEWPQFKAIYELRRSSPLLQLLPGVDAPAAAPAVDRAKAVLRQQLEGLPVGDRQEQLITVLQQEVGRVLGFGAERLPDLHSGFFDLGMDSLMALDLKGRLENSLGVSLPGTLIFECPTVTHLADYLVDEVLGWSATPAAIASHQPNDSTAGTTATSNAGLAAITGVEMATTDLNASIEAELVELERLL